MKEILTNLLQFSDREDLHISIYHYGSEKWIINITIMQLHDSCMMYSYEVYDQKAKMTRNVKRITEYSSITDIRILQLENNKNKSSKLEKDKEMLESLLEYGQPPSLLELFEEDEEGDDDDEEDFKMFI